MKITQNKGFSLSALCFSLLLFSGHEAYSQEKKPDTSRKLTDTVFQLDEVQINTGYETIPKERATGSFETVSAKMLQHNASTDVLSRLEGITASTQFLDNEGAILVNPPNNKVLSIRGFTGFTSNSWPLIVLDNFPYEGDVNQINPNDISEVTILKDAAATSVWGARAGGGVIVISTKKSRLNQALQTNVSYSNHVARKPDIFYHPGLNAQQFIEVERLLYDKGKYNAALNNRLTYPYISPVVELLQQYHAGQIDSLAMEQQISSFYGQDIRNDYAQYLYRPAIRQQLNLQFSGGGQKVSYLFSTGYDDNREHLVSASYKRLSIRSQATMRPVEHLSIETAITYSRSQTNDIGGGTYLDYGIGTNPIPYLKLKGAPGRDLYNGMRFRQNYIDSLRGLGYLDWSNNPLNELGKSEQTHVQNDLLINLGVNYDLTRWLKAGVKYQYELNRTAVNNLQGQESYATRDLINNFTTYQAGVITHYLPVGDWLRTSDEDLTVHQLRGQLNADQQWGDRHELHA